MSKPKNQHWVPACYLSEFADSEDKVWIFDKDGKKVRHQKPEKIFRSNNLYTVEVKGKKDYRIEQNLSNIEGLYSKIFKNKIKNKLPLSEYEHIVLCIFVAAQLQRTLRSKKNQEKFIQQIIEQGEQMAMAHGVNFQEKEQWQSYKKDMHKFQLIEGLPMITDILYRMNIAFICSGNPKRHWFITSDDPCVLFNPDLQWQRFYGPGLGQKNVQLTLPLSPHITVLFCWGNFHGYSYVDDGIVEDLNRMSRAHCDKEFVTPMNKTKWIWFRRAPLNLFFLIKVIKTKILYMVHDLKYKKQHHG